MNSSPESLRVRELLLLGSPQDAKVPPFLPSKGSCQKQGQLPSPASHSPKRGLKPSSFSTTSSALSPLLCFLELQLIILMGGGREGAWGHKPFFLQYKASLPFPSPSPAFLGFLLFSECSETGQLREGGDCGTRSFGADARKGPKLWADAVSCRL